jgi:multidrug efflux pump subunit AcrB
VKNKVKKIYSNDGRDRLLPQLSLAIFNRPRLAAVFWVCLMVFGIISYTTLLKREGFPSINIPYSVVSGTYFVNDPQKVDTQIAKPISDIILQDKRVKSVGTTAEGNFYFAAVQYTEDTDANVAGREIKQKIDAARVLPVRSTLKVETPKIGFTTRGDDGVISVYAKNSGATTEQLAAEGAKVAAFIKDQGFPEVESVSVVDPFVEGTDPVTGKNVTNQTKFDRYGERTGDQNKFYDSVSVGFSQKDGTDVIKLDDKVRAALATYNSEHAGSPYQAVVSATYANDIKDQIGGLQQSLLEGLLAVLVIGSIVIAIRASFVTVLAMITVLSTTLAVMYLVGYTLNTITLFSLVLCLGLIVDDTIIMVEAIDAQRRRLKDPKEIVHVATRKVSRAMVAATSTAILSFAPLLFVGGILGSFIHAIPVTVISALLISLLVALIFIPLFARYLLLGKKQLGKQNLHEPAAGIESKIAHFIGKPMLWASHSKPKLFFVGITALVIGIGFIAAAGFLFTKVTFNIFPPTKDSNGLIVTINNDPGTTIKQAEATADRANKVIASELGSNFTKAAYYTTADAKSTTASVYLISFKQRDVTAPQLSKQLNERFKNFAGAQVEAKQQDIAGPPAAFSVRIESPDRAAALKVSKDMKAFLTNRELTRVSGTKAKIISTTASDPDTYNRADSKSYVDVGAKFDADDTSALVGLAKDAIQKEFTAQKLASYGLAKDALNFDIGQEQENQDSFSTLIKAFPILLLVIFLLLSIQFRSLLQPLLIFMAIPFSLFGITLGLFVTDNPFSFFAMLGFFALIGLSIKNTILLTDYANQLRRDGLGAVDAAVGALSERFRPLIATSFTAVVSLIPLYLSDPFWQSLTVVLIFGLLSSTFLVLTVFPYYYLGAEYLRLRVTRFAALSWLVLTIALSVGLVKAGVNAAVIPAVAIIVFIIELVYVKLRRRSRRTRSAA